MYSYIHFCSRLGPCSTAVFSRLAQASPHGRGSALVNDSLSPACLRLHPIAKISKKLPLNLGGFSPQVRPRYRLTLFA